MLLFEHKTPGTLRKSDWENNTLFNAEEIVRTGSEISLRLLPRHSQYLRLYGLSRGTLDFQTYPLWHSLERIEMKIFFEDRPEKFLYAIIAMVTQGLLMRRLVNKWH